MAEPTRIEGLPLPVALVTAMAEGRWPGNYDHALLERVFGEKPDWPRFYSGSELRAANAGWRRVDDPIYFGQRNDAHPPGDIDPERSLLIGELGPEQDVALDYRESETEPSVLFASDDLPAQWHRVADSVEDLLRKLRW